MKGGVIYQIYVDAFARGSSGRAPGRERGGDLEGVLERLDYVAALGAGAVWLTPICPAPSDHGYNITDYFRVDPRLAPPGPAGAAEELFAAVVDRAHELGVRVLLDLPLNHVGHAYDLATVAGPNRPQVRPPRTRQEHGWARDLKYFDHDDAATRRFLFDVARFWVERFGVDGFRYDYVHGVANPFWEALYAELRELRGDLFVVGEHWDELGGPEENARDIASRFDGEAGPCFDTLFDFPFQAAAVDCLASGAAERLFEVIRHCEAVYPRPACAMLDNHDTARVGDWVGGAPERLALALRLLASRPGPVSLLYGTETGLRAERPPKRSVDESSRVPMNWETAGGGGVDLCRTLFGLRASEPALRDGAYAGGAAAGGLFVELRAGAGGSRVLTMLNFASEPSRPGVALEALRGESFAAEALCGGDPVVVADGALLSALPPYGGGIYRLPGRDGASARPQCSQGAALQYRER